METVFLDVLNTSIIAGWLALVIMVLRQLFLRISKSLCCALWVLVAIRLICPFSIESPFSLVPSTETVSEDIFYEREPGIDTGIRAVNTVVNPIISKVFEPQNPGDSVNPIRIVINIAAILWIFGMIVMALYSIISWFYVRQKVREAVPMQDNIWLCDRISTPFILGMIRPRIYLPSTMSEQDRKYVIAHEKAHIVRHDHWWKPLGFLLFMAYWFHPVLWIAYILFCRDIELACDEKVIKDMGMEVKKSYASALINCSASRKTIAACPLAFGEVHVENRIKSVLNYRKPAFWSMIAAVAVCLLMAVCFLTNPVEELNYSMEDGYTDHENVDVRITELVVDEASPYLVMKWDNQTGKTIEHGAEFHVYRKVFGIKTSCAKTINLGWEDILYGVSGAAATREINLSDFDVSSVGDYVLEFWFSFEGEEEEYKAYLNFSATDSRNIRNYY